MWLIFLAVYGVCGLVTFGGGLSIQLETVERDFGHDMLGCLFVLAVVFVIIVLTWPVFVGALIGAKLKG